jgi:ribosome-associated protein
MEDEKSKSQKKRDAEALQALGVKLIALSNEQLKKIPLPDNLRLAIIQAKSINSNGAIRRQTQFIGKLMRTVDATEILTTYNAIKSHQNTEVDQFHDVELWRTRLLNEGNSALTTFIETYHPEDVPQLRQLIKKTIEEQSKGQHTGAHRSLFRFIRSCI